MLPAQRNKVDISSLSEEEQKMFRLYGKLPNRKDVLSAKLKERKYFDSGDYALSKAGKAPQHAVGTAIPSPQVVPHASTVGGSTSPPAAGATAGSPPIAAPSTSPAHRATSIGIPGSGHHAAGTPGASGLSTSPTTSSSLGATGRPAHSQVSAFPIGSANASTSPTSAAGLAAPSAGSAQAGSPSGAISPGKEASGLGRNEISAEDLMEE